MWQLLIPIGFFGAVAILSKGIYSLEDEPYSPLPALVQGASPPVPQPMAVAQPPPLMGIDLPEIQEILCPSGGDWTWEALRDIDRYPHLLILGKTGSGKSTLARKLLQFLGGAAMVLDPHAAPGSWGAVTVKGAGRNYGEIERSLSGILTEMNRRFALLAGGITTFPSWLLILDEVPSISANCPTAAKSLKTLARESRKVGIRLIILSQGQEVKTLGIEGEGSIRDQFLLIHLAGFIPKDLQEEAKSYSYPIAIEGQLVTMEELPPGAGVGAVSDGCDRGVGAVTAHDRERLEALLHQGYTTPTPHHTDTNSRFTPEGLPPGVVLDRISQLKAQGFSQTRIIETLWGCTKGTNNAYRHARAEYQQLTGE